MSSLSTTGAVALLKLLFRNEAFALVGDATGLPGSTIAGCVYIGLHTAEPVGDQSSFEFSDGGYSRVAIARSASAWTLDDSPDVEGRVWVVNAADIVFPEVAGVGATLTHASIGTAETGEGLLLLVAELAEPIEVEAGNLPKLASGSLRVSVVVSDP